MKLFLGFLFACILMASVLEKRDMQLNVKLLTALCMLVCVGYFFFRLI